LPVQKKGHLLHQPRWTSGKRDPYGKSFVLFLFGLVLLALGLFIAFPYGNVTGAGDVVTVLVVFSGACLFFGGLGLWLNITTMPFRIYDNGFTLTKVSFIKGIRGEEELVTWDRIKKVSIERVTQEDWVSKHLKIVYDNSSVLLLQSYELPDPLTVFRILKEKVPRKLDSEIGQFIGPEEIRDKLPKYKASVLNNPMAPILLISMLIPFNLSIIAGIPVLRSYGMWTSQIFFDVAAAMFMFINTFIVLTAFATHADLEKGAFRAFIEVTPKGIRIPNKGMGPLIRSVRKEIPFKEIVSFNERLEPKEFLREASVTLGNGQVYRINYDCYEAAIKNSGFDKEEFQVVNPKPVLFKGPIARWNLAGVFILYFLICILLPLSVYIFY